MTELQTTDARELARQEATVRTEVVVAENVRAVGTMDGGKLQRWVVRVALEPSMQYLIKGKSSKLGSRFEGEDDEGGDSGGTWVSEYTASPTAEGYDHLNKVAGIQFHRPPTVHDRTGKEVPNPIHSIDYLYNRIMAIGYSEIGQTRVEVEDIEIDFREAWQAERLKKAGYLMRGRATEDKVKLLRDPTSGAPALGPRGELQFQLPTKDELACSQLLASLRNFGGRRAETIARRRLLARMFGLRTLWKVTQAEKPALYRVYVVITGWRDELTADERLARARQEQAQVFGSAIGEQTEAVTEGEFEAVAEEDEDAGVVVQVGERAVDPETGEIAMTPEEADAARADLRSKVDAGIIPGITVGLPGEKLAKAVCGARDVVGPHPCTRPPGHWDSDKLPHQSEDGTWPSA